MIVLPSINFGVFISAGAGRTGAYIAIDLLTDMLQDVHSIDPVKEVMTMRENRKDMVQNEVSFLSVLKIYRS